MPRSDTAWSSDICALNFIRNCQTRVVVPSHTPTSSVGVPAASHLSKT